MTTIFTPTKHRKMPKTFYAKTSGALASQNCRALGPPNFKKCHPAPYNYRSVTINTYMFFEHKPAKMPFFLGCCFLFFFFQLFCLKFFFFFKVEKGRQWSVTYNPPVPSTSTSILVYS
jgi:hypothetical protein